MEETPVSKAKPIDFKYKTRYVKECRVIEFNSPHRDPGEAELDIEMAERFFGYLDRLEVGESTVDFKVRYIPNPDGTYSPMFYDMEINRREDRPTTFEDKDLSLWNILKMWWNLKKIKLNRTEVK